MQRLHDFVILDWVYVYPVHWKAPVELLIWCFFRLPLSAFIRYFDQKHTYQPNVNCFKTRAKWLFGFNIWWAICQIITESWTFTFLTRITQKSQNKRKYLHKEKNNVLSRTNWMDKCLIYYLKDFFSFDISGGGEEWSGRHECMQPLGMEAHTIPPHQISASSSYNEENTGPQFSR